MRLYTRTNNSHARINRDQYMTYELHVLVRSTRNRARNIVTTGCINRIQALESLISHPELTPACEAYLTEAGSWPKSSAQRAGERVKNPLYIRSPWYVKVMLH